ncbi:MAG: type 4a pilus biogenesis protein PilO [Desulfatitalea sp.]|nr:type 4a pilus biogenesis protein PilO [Desulfatitalea sp.]
MKKGDTSPGALAPLFAKIEGLTKPQRIGIYASVLVVLIGLSIYLLLWPKHQDIDRLQNQLATVERELETAKKNAAELNDWRNRMQKKEAEFREVMQALPETQEIPSLLAGVSEAGKDAGLEFLLFQPKPENKKDFYAEIPVDIVVSGSYHQVALFFDKVANLPRIVNIRDIKLAPQSRGDDSSVLNTSCQAVTYKFIEAAQQQQAGQQQTGQRRR